MLSVTRFCLQTCRANTARRIVADTNKTFLKHNGFKPQKVLIRSGATAAGAPGAAAQSPRVVGWWLMGCGGMAFVAVALGGITRLAEAGLSMVDWKLFGRPPPANAEEWQIEFEKYQESPEYKLKNADISLQDFKWIWMMEYGHRMWGRTIGAVFYLPAMYFAAKGYFPARGMKIRVGVMGALLACQGLLGWYMVKSGLDHKNFEGPEDGPPRVSQYRLAAHLSAAMVLYSVLIWNGLEILLPKASAESVRAAISSEAGRKAALQFRKVAMSAKTLIFLTAVSGAFVAGLDAGLTYNTFPLMADRFIPTDLFAQVPFIRNFTENPTTVQFDHRILGTTTLAAISYVAYRSRKVPLPPRVRTAAAVMLGLGWCQVALGIATLLLFVPTPLAAMHQSGAMLTLTSALWLSNELQVLKVLKHIPK